ncbi:MAG TPA: hypothetical protein VGN88_12865 [Phycisphaerae bacterium]
MSRFIQASVLAAAVVAGGSFAMGDTVQVVVPTGLSNAAGSPVGFDGDKPAPGGAAGAPTGFGDSSLGVNVAAGDYRTLRVYVQDLFAGQPGVNSPLTLSDLQSISFDTFGDDAYAIIYTGPNPSGSPFYTGRVLAQASVLTNPGWQTNSSADGTLVFQDTTSGIPGPALTFSQVQSLNTSPIMWIDFKIGATAFPATNGQLDAVSLTFDGVNRTLDLVAVPLPPAVTAGMALLGLLGVGTFLRNRRRVIA